MPSATLRTTSAFGPKTPGSRSSISTCPRAGSARSCESNSRVNDPVAGPGFREVRLSFALEACSKFPFCFNNSTPHHALCELDALSRRPDVHGGDHRECEGHRRLLL